MDFETCLTPGPHPWPGTPPFWFSRRPSFRSGSFNIPPQNHKRVIPALTSFGGWLLHDPDTHKQREGRGLSDPFRLCTTEVRDPGSWKHHRLSDVSWSVMVQRIFSYGTRTTSRVHVGLTNVDPPGTSLYPSRAVWFFPIVKTILSTGACLSTLGFGSLLLTSTWV